MITAWRAALKAEALWFGFIQLSTWCCLPPSSLPEMREAQTGALALPNVGMATNADHGLGCAIHPSAKQFCAKRLAHVALAQLYKQSAVPWQSPTYKSATQLPTILPDTTSITGSSGGSSTATATASVRVKVELDGVGASGLRKVHPANYVSPQYGANASGPFVSVDCTATFPAAYPNRTTYNASMAEQCAWASIQVKGHGWLNASVDIISGDGGTTGGGSGGSADAMVLTAQLPASVAAAAAVEVVASSYGWGPIPMMSIYRQDADLPVLAWNKTLA